MIPWKYPCRRYLFRSRLECSGSATATGVFGNKQTRSTGFKKTETHQRRAASIKGARLEYSARAHICPVARASILMAYHCTSCNAATTANPASLAKKTTKLISTGWAKLSDAKQCWAGGVDVKDTLSRWGTSGVRTAAARSALFTEHPSAAHAPQVGLRRA